MNATQALAQARKRWGKSAAVKDDGKRFPSSPQLRATASARREHLRATLPDPADRTKEQKDEYATVRWQSMHYRYSVGHIALGLFFSVEGTGDSWEEAFAEADRRAERFKAA